MSKTIPAKSLAVRLGADAATIVQLYAKRTQMTPRLAAELYICRADALLSGKIELAEFGASFAQAPAKAARKARKTKEAVQ